MVPYAPRTESESLDFAVEALVFAAEAPLSADDARRVLADVTGASVSDEDVAASVARLNAEYAGTDRAFRILRAGGGYRMASVEDAAPLVRSLLARDDERRLSRSLLETLAVVAYRQPVTKPEVDHVRGVGSDYALRGLMEKGLVAIAGRAETVGRPLLYGTTDAFLDLFGLAATDDLPRPREIDDLLADPQFARERADLVAGLGPEARAALTAPDSPSDAPDAAPEP